MQGRYRGGMGEITFAISASRSAMNSSSVGPGDVGEIYGRSTGDLREITRRSAMKSSLVGPKVRGRG
jgi:hypothetical protein